MAYRTYLFDLDGTLIDSVELILASHRHACRVHLGESLPDALTVDAAATFPLSSRLAIEARAENIADARVVAGISGDGLVERATPRTLWIGLRFRD